MLNALALKLIAGVAAFLMLVVLVQDRNRWKARATSLQAQLNQISTKRDQQKVITTRNVDHVKVITHEAERRARVIEGAPLPGDCKTPAEVMGSDI